MAKSSKTKEKKGIMTWPLYIVLVAVFVLYILFQGNPSLAIVFGVAAFVLIIALIGLEVINGSKESGKLRNALEIVIAVVAVLIFWFALKALLHTNYPIDAVPSCSMLPALQRGDLIVLHGANASKINAPQVQVTSSAMQSMLSNIGSESLECIAYQVHGNNVNITQIMFPGSSIGLFKSEANGRGTLINVSNQGGNLVKYTCGVTNIDYQNGTVQREVYTQSIMIGNSTITGDHNNSIIVYQTIPKDYFYQVGDSYIVHRVYAVINASGTYYYLTKGDNNPGLDMQYQNYPINGTYVQGKVIGKIPLLGYLKLILSGTLSQPAGCNSTLQDQ